MITFNELREQTTSDIIKQFVELTEGFEWIDNRNEYSYNGYYNYWDNFETTEFITLLHRAVEGWNKIDKSKNQINILTTCVQSWNIIKGLQDYVFENYKSENLTQAECAILHCLLDVFKQEERDE